MTFLIVHIDHELPHDELECEVDDAENVLLLEVFCLETPHLLLQLVKSCWGWSFDDFNCLFKFFPDVIGARLKAEVLDKVLLSHQNDISQLGEIFNHILCVVLS